MRGLLADALYGRAVAGGGSGNAAGERVWVSVCADEDDVRAAIVADAAEVVEIGDHERVFRRGGELLHDPGDVEGSDPESSRPVIEHP